MRLIVLGGAGDMGSRAVEDLVAARGVERVTIADRDLDGAYGLAARLAGRGAPVDVRRIDATDHGGLVEAMRGYDVAASAVGPFFRFEAGLVRAAIEAGTDYCSLCDEWQPAEAVLDELDGPARRAGVTVLTCLGASPGLTNVSVAHLAAQLDRADRARIAVYLPLDAGGGAAALRHGLHIMTGEVAVWRDGRRTLVPACGERLEVALPGAGPVATWNMGHAEPVTLPRTIGSLADVSFWMGFGTGAAALVGLARSGAFSSDRRAAGFVRIFDLLERRLSGATPGRGALRVDVWGERDGRPRRLLHCGVGEMRNITGLSLAVGALMLGRGQLRVHGGGAFAPEALLEPATFLSELRLRGVVGYADLAMTQPVG